MADDIQSKPAADPYGPENYSAIKEKVKKKREDWSKGRERFLLAGQRNIRYYRGVQWDLYDRRIGRWRPRVLPKGTPTPVTNRFAASIDAIVAVFARVEPTLMFRPGSPDEPDDRAAADVASRAIEVIEDECNIRMIRQGLAMWVGLTGGAWLETGYDADPIHGMRTVEVDACTGPACGHVQAPAAPMPAPPEPAMDPTMGAAAMPPMPPQTAPCEQCGAPTAPATQQYPKGKMYVDVVPLTEMYFDPAVTDWSKHRSVIREKSVPLDEAKARWKDIADKITPNVMSGVDEVISESLPTLAPALDDQTTSRYLWGNPRPSNNRVTEQWYSQLPDETYPEGLLAIIVGKEHLAFAGPLPYGALQEDGTSQPFLNYTWFPQKPVPGTMFPKTVADDLALIQDQRNRFESLVIACAMRMGSPVWIVPAGSNIGTFAGEPGAVMKYAINPTNPSAKPERVQGPGIPLAFIQRIEMLDKDSEDVGATFDVIKGSRPAGISAGIALQILQERGMSRFGPLFIQWETSWAEWARQAIEIFRAFATEERLRKIKGRDGAWEVQKFIGADLQGRVDVIPEAGSSMPRSTMVQRAEFEQAVTMGLLPIQDPEVQFKGLELYGLSWMLPNMKADTKNAFMENEEFDALAQDPNILAAVPDDVAAARQMDYLTLSSYMQTSFGVKLPAVDPAMDDHAIHSREHGVKGKSETARAWPEILQVFLSKHKEFHDQLRMAQMSALSGLNPQPDSKSGFMQKPPAQTHVLNTSSSMQRMAGDSHEMTSDMGATSGSM